MLLQAYFTVKERHTYCAVSLKKHASQAGSLVMLQRVGFMQNIPSFQVPLIPDSVANAEVQKAVLKKSRD
jgi:hypothetical protein